jgi:hypothetical protein
MGQIQVVHRGLAYGDGVMSGAGLAGKLVKLSGADTFAPNTDPTVESFGILAVDCADGGRPTVYCDGGIYETDVFASAGLQPGDGLYCDSNSKLAGGYDDATQAIKATLTTGTADTNQIVWQAKNGGTIGNGISITIVKNGTATPLSISVSSLAITVNLETAAVTGNVVSTAAEVVDAIDADTDASALVRAVALTPSGVQAAKTHTHLADGADAALKVGTVLSVVGSVLKFVFKR